MTTNKKLKINTMPKHCAYTALIGRIFIASVFIFSGVLKVLGFNEMLTMIAQTMPLPKLMLIIAIIIEILGGAAILIGFKTRIASTLLVLLLTIATFIFVIDYSKFDIQNIGLALSNLAIIGGLLGLVSAGAGKISIDKE